MSLGPIIETDWIAEDQLAALLGVAREVVKRERPYVRTGGVESHGKTIRWRQDAVQDLAKKLAIPVATKKLAPPIPSIATPTVIPEPVAPVTVPEKKAAVLPGEEMAVVSRPVAGGKHYSNPNLIQCKRATGELVYVRVLDSGKYLPLIRGTTKPMMVRARKASGGSWWELLSREPRWPGIF